MKVCKIISNVLQKIKVKGKHTEGMSFIIIFAYILKPILFYLLIILFDGSGDINFSYCFVFTFVFRLSLHTSAVNHDECCMSHVLKQSRFTVQL